MKLFISIMCTLFIISGCGSGTGIKYHHFTETKYLFLIETDRKYGYINQNGGVVYEPQFTGATHFNEGLASVLFLRNTILINEKGQVVKYLPPLALITYSEGLAPLEYDWLKGYMGYVDRKGEWVFKTSYEQVNDFNEGLASFEENGKYGFINKNGDVVVPNDYDDVKSFSEDKCVVKLSGKYGYIDKSGNIVVGLKYDYAGDFGEGLAPVQIGSRAGYIDHSGKYVIEPKFIYTTTFSEGYAGIEIGYKMGYIDKNGLIVIRPIYKRAEPFHDGAAVVTLEDDSVCFINKKGEVIFKVGPSPYLVEDFRNGLALIYWTINNSCYINNEGQIIWQSGKDQG